MAARRNNSSSDEQLDLFSTRRPTHDTADAIRPDGRETLARIPPENGARPGTEGVAAPDASGGGGKDEGRNGHAANGIDEAGKNGAASPDAGVGNGAGEIHPPATRRIIQRHQEEPSRNLDAYRITEADRLGEGGPKLKFQKNIAAIETLRQLDAEERQATPEEKAALVKYVGWGAMPQVFDVDNTDWRKEQFRLSKILSDEEHRSARATTLNAHYTAPSVIGAMYRAAGRFGFKGGRVLEPACGIGHFVGLMPEEMLRRSTVTGIEIDPLTA